MSAKIQLYSLATPNGQKVSIALEEMEIPYEAQIVDIRQGTQFEDWFKAINPNSKIPAIVDPRGPDGKEIAVFESGAILLYLAEKSGKFLSQDPRTRMETLQWLFFQMAGVGPMFGQFGHFHRYALDKCDHPYPKERYMNEVKRLLKVLDDRLEGRKYLVGEDYSIADIATFPWVGCLDWGYSARDILGIDEEYRNVLAWHDRCSSRPKAILGAAVCPLEL